MKQKILLLLLTLLALGSMFAQVPTTNLDGEYLFTSGSMLDTYSTNDLTKTGTLSTTTTDRFGNTTGAINLGGDYLQRSSLQNLTQFSGSFWVKTTTNDAVSRTIIDQSERVNQSTGVGYRGWFVSLKNGKIELSGNYRYNYSNSSGVTTSGNTGWTTRISSTNVADGNWHHVTVAVKSRVYFWQQSHWMLEANYVVYVDGVKRVDYLHNKPTYSTNWASSPAIFVNKPVTIGNNETGNIATTNVYTDEIDDIRIYKGTLLSAAQVLLLYNEDPCFPKNVDVADTTINSATVNWSAISGQNSWDVAYVESGQAIANATITSNLTVNTLGLTGLTPNTAYDVYVRGNCSGSVSDWTNAVTFNTDKEAIYVNKNAVGANDGTSWADAFVSLNDAIDAAVTSIDEIWVATGTYTPTSGTGRNATFLISKSIEIYGGFNGTETHVSQRDLLTNVTILSGDLNGDDSTTITDTETTRQDNSYHVIRLLGSIADGAIIDGFTISGGNANGTNSSSCPTSYSAQYYNSRGGAISVQPNLYNGETYMKFNNCIIENNSATGMAVYYTFGPCGLSHTRTDIDFSNSIIRDNYSVDYSTFYYGGSGTYSNVRNGDIVNCLFYNNYCENEASVLTLSASGGVSAANVNVINSTFSKNVSGTSKVIRMYNASNCSIKNSIIYDNGSASSMFLAAGTAASVSNSIIEGGQLSADSSDPLFTDAANDDFTLQATSPARDAGNNSVIPSDITTDLLGNQRIFNTTVDLGAYENTDPIVRVLTLTAINGTITAGTLPTNGGYNDGTVVGLTAVPITGYKFDSWSGDASGTTNPLNITMDADKTVTANFSKIQRTLTINATNGSVNATGALNARSSSAPIDFYFYHGDTSTLTAIPDSGYQFDGWSGAVTGTTNPESITMDADKTVTATFSPIQRTLIISETNTTVTASPSPVNGTYADGTVITLTAVADANHFFNRWNRTGFASNPTNPLVITLNSDETIYAVSDAITRTLNVNTTITNSQRDGFVSDGVTNNFLGNQYLNNTNVTLTATPRTSNYEFLGWSGDVTSTANPLSLTMNSDKTILANFGLFQYTLTTNATNGSITRSVSPTNGTYDIGTNVLLTAVPATGYQFDEWSGSATGTTNPFYIGMYGNQNVTAVFSLIPAPIPTFVNSPTNISEAYTATINFSSGVQGFSMNDIQVTGASLSNFVLVSGTVYKVLVTPTSICSTSVTLQVPANVAQDTNSVSNVASAITTVNAIDNVNPTVVAQNFTLQLDANGNGTLTVADIDNGSLDNCSIATRVLDKTSFDCSNIGANTVKLTVTDASNNSSDTTVTVTVEDKVAPTVVVQNITVQLGTNGQVNITTSDINNGSSDNCAISTMSLDKHNFTCNNLGVNNVVLTVEDASGNTNTTTAVVTVNQNPNAQLAAVTQNITVQLDASGSVTITPQQIDNGSGSGCNSNPILSLDKTTFDCSNIGANTVTLTATDSGTSVTATATVTVEDKIEPTVVAQNFTLQLDAAGQGTLTVANIDNGSSDNCSIATRTLDKTSFTCSDLGANAVKLTVVDTSGNSVDAAVTVTVEDKIAPTVIVQNISVQLGTNGQVNITSSDINNGSSDNCAISSMSLDKHNFTCNNLGANNVVLTVEDASGNTNTATAVITVNQNPNAQLAAVTQNITVQLDASGSVTITPQQIDNGSGSGCNSNPTLSLDKTTFDCSNIGANTVTLTATDSGTSVTATATVTVEDKIDPTVVAQNFTLQLDSAGQGILTVADIDNGSSDNCSIVTRTLDKTSFTCSDLGANAVKLTVVDVSGNSVDTSVTVTVEDKIDPTTIVQNISVQLGAGGQVTITPQQVNNGSSDNCTIIANLTYSLDTTTFTCSEVGQNNVVLTVTDASGNSATANAVVTVSENPNLPLSTVTQDITVQLDASGSVTITPGQVDNGSGSGCNSNPTLSLDTTTFDCSNIGVNTVVLTASDGSTSVIATATVTVEDTMAPTVITQDITVDLDVNGTASVSVSDIDNGSSDNCTIDTRTLDRTSFTCSDLGTNTVILTIVDAEGNIATETAVVTIIESVAPTVLTQNITVALDINGNANITAQQIDNGSSDSCSGIATMSLDTSSFNCPILGDVTVVLTVTDNSGNTANATAIVTITGPDEDNDGISDACDSKEILFNKGFSPNGDGQNDTWVIENIDNYPKNKVTVFNRWGEKIFQANNYQNDWDGKSNQRGGSSEKLPVGSYLYIIHLNEPGVDPIQGWLYINY